MNLEEAKANIGKEVMLDESTKPYSNSTSILSSRCQDIKKGTILGIENKSVLIDVYGGYHMFVSPQDLKLKEQPMQNYKIKVTPETSEEVQKLFFELGYSLIKDHYYHPDMDYLLIGKNFISYSNSFVSFSECEYQEITLPQLRDLVVLKHNDVNDATHVGRSGSQYYHGYKDYLFDGVRWMEVTLDDISNLIPTKKESEMTYQDALRALADGKEVEMLDIHNQWENLKDFYVFLEPNNKFRIKPQTTYLVDGNYTKEELLKIAGEME